MPRFSCIKLFHGKLIEKKDSKGNRRKRIKEVELFFEKNGKVRQCQYWTGRVVRGIATQPGVDAQEIENLMSEIFIMLSNLKTKLNLVKPFTQPKTFVLEMQIL